MNTNQDMKPMGGYIQNDSCFNTTELDGAASQEPIELKPGTKKCEEIRQTIMLLIWPQVDDLSKTTTKHASCV